MYLVGSPLKQGHALGCSLARSKFTTVEILVIGSAPPPKKNAKPSVT